MSQPRINNIRSFADVNYEVDWIHKNLTQLSNLLNQETTETLNFTHLSCYDLKITSQADNAITNSGGISSKTYISQSQGYRINANGDADFRYLYTDELHAKAFIADLEQALAGGQIISKSVAKIAREFTIPSAGNSSSLFVEEFMGFTGQVFADGDMIRLRQFTRSSNTTVTVADVWGTVVYTRRWPNGISPSAGNTPLQQYVFTRSAAPNAGTGTGTIAKGTLALDYGVSGQGYYEVTAIDGANGANSPYAQCVTWTTHPQSGCTVKARFGNLAGITSATFGALSGYGLYGNRIYLEGDCYISGVITLVAGSSGSLSLTGGDIAGMTISSTALTATAAGKQTIVSSGATAFSAGTTATPEFKVTSLGALTATSATIKTNTDVGNLKRVEIRSSDNELCFYEASVVDPIVRIGSDVNGTTDGIYVKEGCIYSLNNIQNIPGVLGWSTNATTAIGGSFWATGAGSNSAIYAYADSGTTNYAVNVGAGDINVATGGSYKINGTALAATNIGATTVGASMFALTNPSAITFVRINANNTVSALSAADFRTAIGATTVGGDLFTLTNPSAITFLRVNANNTVSTLSAGDFVTAIGAAPSTQGAAFSSHSTTSGRYVATSSGGSPTTQMGWVVLTINRVSYTVFTSD